MTEILFYRHNGKFWGFKENGHTGYASAGEDILCSALSAMTMLVVNACEIAYASDVDYEVDEGATKIEVSCREVLHSKDEKKIYAVCGLFEAYYYQLNDLTEEYYDNLSVDVIEKDPFEADAGATSQNQN
ncbi:MAG: ribosomal-processing cysteine protease Prp [Ruminococcaceae bacterium]|nr:ribosomal-processing cysteine protease Prp [Oscillospiraceae bacterium]